MSRGFGVAGGLDPEVASPLGARCQELGYSSVWSNDTPIGNGLETIAELAKGADSVDLGVTIALDRQGPTEIASEIERLGLDRDRLWLGVGSGVTEKPLTRMRKALPELREALPGIRLYLAAMGPKMCAFGGEAWDGVFFNWVTPEYAAGSREKVVEGAKEAGREAPPVAGYVRTAVGDRAEERLAKEEGFYRKLHKGYSDHFARLKEPEGTVGVAAENAGEAQSALSEYRALDTVVVRALASATVESMGALAEAAAPGV
jgi:Luciferase-like monooxygenase